MPKEQVILGFIGIFLGIVILIKSENIILSSIPIIIGVFLIFFSKEEDKITKRKDKK
jgi:uncharacterized membrane protein HdeD (DUF308 family)